MRFRQGGALEHVLIVTAGEQLADAADGGKSDRNRDIA
jgi:hypothetical protein